MSANADDPRPVADKVSMNWVMVFWLASFLTVVLFGVATYLLGWFFRRA
jgi:hypothetical protein